MNTFLPYPSFSASARSLDNRRLWKQVVECKQLLNILVKQSVYYKIRKLRVVDKSYWGFGAWSNHPALLMWAPNPKSLVWYAMACIQECKLRGIAKGTKIFSDIAEIGAVFGYNGLPKWCGNKDFHLSHQSNLLRKNKEFYFAKFGDVPNNLEYIWPIRR